MIKPNEKIYIAYFVKRYEINASYFQDTKLSEKGVCTGDIVLCRWIEHIYKRNIEFKIVQIFLAQAI